MAVLRDRKESSPKKSGEKRKRKEDDSQVRKKKKQRDVVQAKGGKSSNSSIGKKAAKGRSRPKEKSDKLEDKPLIFKEDVSGLTYFCLGLSVIFQLSCHPSEMVYFVSGVFF